MHSAAAKVEILGHFGVALGSSGVPLQCTGGDTLELHSVALAGTLSKIESRCSDRRLPSEDIRRKERNGHQASGWAKISLSCIGPLTRSTETMF